MSGIEEKYISVRNRLDAFGYKAPLGVESIPLVERLFADLVHTTESLKKSRISRHSDFSNSQNPKIELESTIEPFRQDNSRLMTPFFLRGRALLCRFVEKFYKNYLEFRSYFEGLRDVEIG